ncbi:MAG: nucleotidyltransferase family protein [bacterium]|nr:nucleotidyltransferase family protein [bacterium]
MKALILAGGRGRRLGEITNDKNKCMTEISGRPLILYSLDCASQLSELSEIVILVGYRADDIMKVVGNSYNGKKIKYVLQSEQKGLVHAIECSKDALQGEDFMLMLADELMTKPKHREMIEKYNQENLFGTCGVIKVDDPSLISKTYAIQVREDGRICDLIEKPEIEKLKDSGMIIPDIMGTGNCIFKNEIISFIPKTPVNQKRNERELPDLIKTAINEGKTVKPVIICDRYFNINFEDEIGEAESFFAHP